MSSLAIIAQQVSIYYCIPVLVAGVLGGLLNTIVFLSLKTFRQNPCAFYLTVMSIVNIGQLFTGLLSRIMISGYNIDWTQMSPFYCKLRYFLLQTCTLISLTCMCLATIDQYFATSSNLQWREWCSLKLAHRLTISLAIFWSLHGILYLIFYAQMYSPITGQITCGIANAIFGKYHVYVSSLILTGFLPVFLTILFALMAFRNIRQLSHQTVPLVRRELEKQLTVMVLVQVAFNCVTLLPSSIVAALLDNTAFISNSNVAAIMQFLNIIPLVVYYLIFASPFYIYICVSERFRRQLIYVLFEMHLNRCRPPRIVVNQVTPKVTINIDEKGS